MRYVIEECNRDGATVTKYEHLMDKAEEAEANCRESPDSYVKTFWAHTADQHVLMARRLTLAEAAEPLVGRLPCARASI